MPDMSQGDSGRFPPGQTLLVDADDTLWENNIYFEQAIASFISYLDHKEYTREQVRERLNEVERENVREHGYGLVSFRRALVTCFERLSPGPVPPPRRRPRGRRRTGAGSSRVDRFAVFQLPAQGLQGVVEP